MLMAIKSIQMQAHCSPRKAHCLACFIFMAGNIEVHLTPADVIRSHHGLHSVYKPTEAVGGEAALFQWMLSVHITVMHYCICLRSGVTA
jgi:hypothetical protein